MFDYNNYIKSRMGKKIDIDHAYSSQCWDGFADYCILNKIPVMSCPLTGFVNDIWNNRKNNNLLNYFDNVPYNDAKPGDWIIWNPCKSYPHSHVAMLVNKNPFQIFSQNQTPSMEYSIINSFPEVKSIACVLRLKEQVTSFPSSGFVQAKVDQIRVRSQPNLEKESDTGYVYNTGNKLYYDSVVEKCGYLWACYTSRTGKRRYVALTSTTKNSKWWEVI